MKLEEAINVLDHVSDRPSLLVAADALLDVGQDEVADHVRQLAVLADYPAAREQILAAVLAVRRHLRFPGKSPIHQHLDALTLAQIIDVPTRILASQSLHDHRTARLLLTTTNQVSIHLHCCYMVGISHFHIRAAFSVGVSDGEHCGSHTFTDQSRFFPALRTLNDRLRRGGLPGNVTFLSDDEHKAVRSVRLNKPVQQ